MTLEQERSRLIENLQALHLEDLKHQQRMIQQYQRLNFSEALEKSCQEEVSLRFQHYRMIQKRTSLLPKAMVIENHGSECLLYYYLQTARGRNWCQSQHLCVEVFEKFELLELTVQTDDL